MCGIAGIAGGGQVDADREAAVGRMLRAIVHRGPDGKGVHAAPGFAFGMRRLSIIDLTGGQQPIANEDHTVWVVCNGEIYNHRELRASLISLGHTFRTRSDAEVIVHLYEELGEKLLPRLKGMFAFAVWDERRRRLLLARDRMGMKPLYYSLHAGCLTFASEVKAIMASGVGEARPGIDSLNQYLRLGYAVAPTTAFRGVSKFAPAEALSWESGVVRKWRYWNPPSAVEHRPTAEKWAEESMASLRGAVDAHLVSDVPVGAFLSGGIDSSAIVAVMSSLRSDPVQTFSIGYSGGRVESYFNELPAAKSISERFHTSHTEIVVQPDLATLLPNLIWHIEEPICDTASLTTALVAQLASKSVKVIMSGVGGDELFAGYRRYLGFRYAAAYARVPRWIRSTINPLMSKLPSGRQNPLLDLVRYSKGFVAGDGLPWHLQYLTYVQAASMDQVSRLLGIPGRQPDSFIEAAEAADCDDPLLRMLRLDWQTQLSEQLLLLTDKVTMAYSIECRVPFLDYDLFDLAAQIPHEAKLPRGELKGLLKRSLAGTLPEDVLHRRKRGFGAPIGHWLKGQLRPIRDQLLSESSVRSRQLIDPVAVSALLQQHDSGAQDHTDLLFVLLSQEIWARLFLDGRAPQDLSDEFAAGMLRHARTGT